MMLSTTIKDKDCKQCGSSFRPWSSTQIVCSRGCASRHVRDSKKAEKEAQRKEVAEFRARKQAAQPIKKLIAQAQTAFNLFIRTRDAGQPCICCGQPFEPEKPGGSVDAGHYLSRGANPQHRFTEDNCFAQRKNCNRPGGTTRAAFRAGVIARIGLERVEALEADTAVRKWTRSELLDIKSTYTAKARQLKKEQE
jgi:hypothetical protein